MTYEKLFDKAMELSDFVLSLVPVDVQHLLGISPFSFMVHHYVTHCIVFYDG